jgi:CSLREA domain-containing protein
MRRFLAGLMLLAISVGFAPSAAAGRSYAVSAIAITTTDDELNDDGDCALREAIVAANTDTVVDECEAGSGADVLFVPAGTYTLTLTGVDENAAATGT